MDNFITTFLFINKANEFSASFEKDQLINAYAIGVGVFLLLVLLVARKEPRAKAGLFFIAIWLAGWSSMSVISRQLRSVDEQRYKQLLQIYNNHEYKIAEGRVHIIEPASSREHGDFITIDGVDFEIGHHSLPFGSFGYMDSIANNGVLTEGVYARVYYVDDVIIRIDLMSSD